LRVFLEFLEEELIELDKELSETCAEEDDDSRQPRPGDDGTDELITLNDDTLLLPLSLLLLSPLWSPLEDIEFNKPPRFLWSSTTRLSTTSTRQRRPSLFSNRSTLWKMLIEFERPERSESERER